MAGLKVLLLLALAVVPALAANYDLSWNQGVDYSGWASSQKIQVGDTVTFQYGGLHTVDEVNKADYEACSTSNALTSASDGNTAISFTQPGTRYFVCGTAGHCAGGMKVAIPVSAASSTPSTPTTPGSSTPATPSTPSSPKGTSTYSEAAGSQPGKALLAVGGFLTALLALCG
uniref:Uclacyanin-2 n=1 Tax=Anthurium amnicola TaxID=1678845 RepID=A0A1D1Z3G1_9ARAE